MPHNDANFAIGTLAHGPIRPAGERRDATGDLRPSPAAAGNVHGGDLRQRRAAVHGAADVHEDGAAASGRRAVGVVGGDRVLPGRAAGGVCLCPLAHALCARPGVGRHSCGGDDRRRLCAAAVDRRRLGAAAGVRGGALADGPVHRLDRVAVLCARREQPVAAGVVRAHRPPRCERPLFPLRRQQYRKLPCARVLSERDRAVRRAEGPGRPLVARLRPLDRASRRLRRVAVALAGQDRADGRRGRGGPAADLARRRVLGCARGRALGPAGRGDRAHLHRRRGGAAALGASARALSLDLRHRVRAPSDHPASAGRRRAAAVHHRPRRRAHFRSAQDHHRAGRACTSRCSSSMH